MKKVVNFVLESKSYICRAKTQQNLPEKKIIIQKQVDLFNTFQDLNQCMQFEITEVDSLSFFIDIYLLECTASPVTLAP